MQAAVKYMDTPLPWYKTALTWTTSLTLTSIKQDLNSSLAAGCILQLRQNVYQKTLWKIIQVHKGKHLSNINEQIM